MSVRHGLEVAFALALTLTLTGCSRFLDARVANACPVPLGISFWGEAVAPDPTRWGALDLPVHSVGADSVETFKDALAAPEGGWDGGVGLVEFEGGSRVSVPIPPGEEEPIGVRVPRSVCP